MTDNKTAYPTIRDMDGVYFRVKRDDEYQAICWSDLTDEDGIEHWACWRELKVVGE